ncbi:MAG: DNA-binding response regulator [Bacteroidetes bacterium]|nr:MAG: DNA-binding response regulator [Bacteroidota bacterium]
MNGPRVYIIEDEVLTIQNLTLILERAGYTVVGAARSGEAALAQIPSVRPQVVLVDVDLSQGEGELDGLQALRRLQQVYPVPCVLLTAQRDPATLRQSLRSHAVGFIGKPFSDNELIFNLEKALEAVPAIPSPAVPPYLFIPKGARQHIKVQLEEVCYIQASNQYITLHTCDQQQHLVSLGIGQFEQRHPHPDFIRIHRSTIVNLRHATGFEEPATLFVCGEAFHLGKNYRQAVKQRLPFLRSG